jgi:preprotein translocase subunit SecE
MALNREQKRMLKKSGDLADDGTPAARRRRETPKAPAPKEQRTTARMFVKESRGELRKVAWPTRNETLNYSAIVAIALVFMTTMIFVLDWAFSNLILKLFNVQ